MGGASFSEGVTPMEMILKILDAMADVATVLAFVLTLIKEHKRIRMTRRK